MKTSANEEVVCDSLTSRVEIRTSRPKRMWDSVRSGIATMSSLEEHRRFMEEAYKEAVQGYEEGGVPVGAVMVQHGKIIARSVPLSFYLNPDECHCLQYVADVPSNPHLQPVHSLTHSLTNSLAHPQKETLGIGQQKTFVSHCRKQKVYLRPQKLFFYCS